MDRFLIYQWFASHLKTNWKEKLDIISFILFIGLSEANKPSATNTTIMTAADRNYREFCILNTLEVKWGVELTYSKTYHVYHVNHFSVEFEPSVLFNDKPISEVVSDIIEKL